MVEALEWMLPDAATPQESIVVLLDWFSAHLTEEVAEVIRRKGHVLLFHGGGCTPFTQVNDTHLHASLARLLVQLENDWAHQELLKFRAQGVSQIPRMDREDIISIVQTAWAGMNHARAASKGYRQTGPDMPLLGKVRHEDVFPDLRTVFEALSRDEGREPDPEYVDMSIRDEAVAFVNAGFEAGRWTTWADCAQLIEEHVDVNELLEEGMEAFEWLKPAPDEEDDDENKGHESDGGDDEAGGDEDGGGGGGGGAAAEGGSATGAGDGEADGGEDGGGDAGVQPGAGFQPDAAAAPGATPGEAAANVQIFQPDAAAADAAEVAANVAAARRLLYWDARKKGNRALMTQLRNQMCMEDRAEKGANATAGMFLRKHEQLARAEDTKRRKLAADQAKEEHKDEI